MPKMGGGEQAFLAKWNGLSDAQKMRIVPVLLSNTAGWKNWNFNDSAIVSWLKLTFDTAGVPFRVAQERRGTEAGASERYMFGKTGHAVISAREPRNISTKENRQGASDRPNKKITTHD